VPAGSHADLGGEGAGELTLREAGAAREGRNRQVLVRVLGDPLLHLAQRLAAC
jgi:hypothetical protein